MRPMLILLVAVILSSCASLQHENGPDTTRKVDADGNPNFGPR